MSDDKKILNEESPEVMSSNFIHDFIDEDIIFVPRQYL